MTKRIIFRTDDVTQSLASVVSVVNQKNAMPILATVAICTKNEVNADGSLDMVLMASDGDIWARKEVRIDGESDKGVSMCLDARSFLQSIQSLPNTVLSVNADTEKHIATCSYVNGKFSLPYYETDAYPKPSRVDTEKSFSHTVDAQILLKAIDKVSFAVGNDPIYIILNGVHLEFGDSKVIAVATDKRRFAKFESKNDNADEHTDSVNLPQKPCKVLSSILQEGESETVDVSSDGSIAVFSAGGFRLTTRLPEGNYVDYQRLIQNSYTKSADVDRDSLMNAVKRVSLMGSSSELVAVSLGNCTCTVEGEDLDNSKAANESIGCEYSGETFRIGLSSTYMTSVLKSIESPTVTVLFDEPTKPAFFLEGEDSESYEYTSMLMPIKFL